MIGKFVDREIDQMFDYLLELSASFKTSELPNDQDWMKCYEEFKDWLFDDLTWLTSWETTIDDSSVEFDLSQAILMLVMDQM